MKYTINNETHWYNKIYDLWYHKVNDPIDGYVAVIIWLNSRIIVEKWKMLTKNHFCKQYIWIMFTYLMYVYINLYSHFRCDTTE